MNSYSTIIQSILAGQDGPDIFIQNASDAKPLPFSRADWINEAMGFARLLSMSRVEPGDRVVLMLPTSRELLIGILATWMAGGIAVVVAPFERGVPRLSERLHAIFDSCTPKAVVASERHLAMVPDTFSGRRFVENAVWGAACGSYTGANVQPSDLALLQYTSGSTGYPKGVCISHENIVANLEAIGRRIAVSSHDRCLGWLPIHHDMGMIGQFLFPIFHKLPSCLLATEHFVRNPSVWLKSITNFSATLSPAPTFAYALLGSRVAEQRLQGINLENWRYAWVGAEPIFGSVLSNFERRFARFGLRHEALHPAYGLAEATLAVSHDAPETVFQEISVHRERFRQGGHVEVLSPNSARGINFVACGPVLDNVRVEIRDDHKVLGDEQEGEIWIGGPAISRGYWGDEPAGLFSGNLTKTGDLGFILNGQLYITGRTKDLIIRSGVNIHPYELERAAVLPGVRAAVAFSRPSERLAREEVIIVIEGRFKGAKAAELAHDVRLAVQNEAGIQLDKAYVTSPGCIPRTTSGKLQRNFCRTLFEAGELPDMALESDHPPSVPVETT